MTDLASEKRVQARETMAHMTMAHMHAMIPSWEVASFGSLMIVPAINAKLYAPSDCQDTR